jgi:hypothetical protein
MAQVRLADGLAPVLGALDQTLRDTAKALVHSIRKVIFLRTIIIALSNLRYPPRHRRAVLLIRGAEQPPQGRLLVERDEGMEG